MFEVSSVKYIPYPGKLYSFLNTPNSGDRKDLWKYLEKQALKAVAGAKRQVGVDTGELRKSISLRHRTAAYGQLVTINADNEIAYLHHEGTRPHMIYPKNGKVLHFRVGRGSVFATAVSHPGTRKNPYLRDQLHHFRG